MGLFDKFVGGLRMNQNEEDEEYFLDDDYQDEEYDDEQDEPAPRGGIFTRFGSPKEDNYESRGSFFKRNQVIQGGSSMEVTMIRPASLDDSRVICDNLLDGRAVVLNMEGMNTEIAQRIIDFTLGAIYSINGDLQMISKYIFIASPQNVELSGDFQGDFANMNNQSSYKSQPAQSQGSAFSFSR